MSLSKAGFKHNQIEQAMTNTVQYGGDLIDALDWLCLNLANGISTGFNIVKKTLMGLKGLGKHYSKQNDDS